MKKKSPSMESSKTTIDDLPGEILLNILSFLPTTTAVQTSAVARKWCNLWHSIPVLDFCMFEFYCYSPDKSIRDTRQLFAEFISRTLLQCPRHCSLEKFHLFFNFINCDTIRAYVNSWVRYAIGSKATEIELDLDSNFAIHLLLRIGKHVDFSRAIANADDDIYLYYDFHFSHLMNSSVQVLKLSGCNFCLPSNELAVKFDSIREIYLQGCYSSDWEIEKLMALCANVEFLSLDIIRCLKNFKIVSPKLKQLVFGIIEWVNADQSSIEICAPSLESIMFNGFCAEKYIFKDTSPLVEAHVHFDSRRWRDFVYWTNIVRLLGGVQRLTFQNL